VSREELDPVVAAALPLALPDVPLPPGGKARLLREARRLGEARKRKAGGGVPPPVLLVTECLQQDFLRPLAPGEEPPCAMHVGNEGSRKLLGDDAARGPLARLLGAYGRALRASPRHSLVTVYDIHEPGNPADAEHFAQCGTHCFRGTPGAELVEPARAIAGAPRARMVTMDDMTDAAAPSLLPPPAGSAPKVAFVGLFTDANIRAHALAFRRLGARVAISDAMATGTSPGGHAGALAELGSRHGVEVLATADELAEWLEAA
jgi:nicotinamidase-related amidase